jgi:hypothetical protein
MANFNIMVSNKKARCSGSHLFGRQKSGGLWLEATPDKKLVRPPSQQISLAWRYAPIMLAIQEAISSRILVGGRPWAKIRDPT